jgi:hypothetical protein
MGSTLSRRRCICAFNGCNRPAFKGSAYCSVRHRDAAANGNARPVTFVAQASGFPVNTAAAGKMCQVSLANHDQTTLGGSENHIRQNCHLNPVYVENGRVHDFCGRRCARAFVANSVVSTAPQPALPMCQVSQIVEHCSDFDLLLFRTVTGNPYMWRTDGHTLFAAGAVPARTHLHTMVHHHLCNSHPVVQLAAQKSVYSTYCGSVSKSQLNSRVKLQATSEGVCERQARGLLFPAL